MPRRSSQKMKENNSMAINLRLMRAECFQMVLWLWLSTTLCSWRLVIQKDSLCSDFCFWISAQSVEKITSIGHARLLSWIVQTDTSTIWMTSNWTRFSKLAAPLRWSSKITIHLHMRSNNSRWLSIHHKCLTRCNKAVNLRWWRINTKWETRILTNSSIKWWLQINNNSSLNKSTETWLKLLNSSYRWDRELMQICPLKSEHRNLFKRCNDFSQNLL